MTPSGPDHERVEELAFDCLEAADVDAALEAACAQNPELADLLRRMVARLRSDAFLDAESPALGEIPEVLGHYRLAKRLGAGGMGVVHIARDERLRRAVALKLVRPELLYFPGSRERFQREVDAVARLRHPHIVTIHEFGEQAGIPFYAMELVDGSSLDDRLTTLKGRPADQLEAVDLIGVERSGSGATITSWVDACSQLAIEVASALQHAHDEGVVHRDIKPSNILIDLTGRARVVDFGLARLDDGQELTRTTSQIGSLPYMPPEQLGGQLQEHGPRQDLYSLGVTLYEALTLTNPFMVGSVEETRRRIMDAAPLAPRRLNRKVSWELETVCLKAMAPEPGRRYASMAEFATDLENVRARRPILARRAGPIRRSWRWTQRHPLRVTLTSTAILLFGVLPIAFGLYQRDVSKAMLSLARDAEDRAALASVTGAASGLAARDALSVRQALEIAPEDRRNFAWHRLSQLADESEAVLRVGAPIRDIATRPDGRYVAAATDDGQVAVVDLKQPEAPTQLIDGLDGEVAILVFWMDESRVAVVSRSGSVRAFEWSEAAGLSHEPDELIALGNAVECAACSPDRRQLVVGHQDGQLELLDLSSEPITRRELLRLPKTGPYPMAVLAVDFSADGKQILSTRPGGVDLFTAPFGDTPPRRLPADAIEEDRSWILLARFVGPAGNQILYLNQRGELHLVDVQSGLRAGGRAAVASAQARDILSIEDPPRIVLGSQRGISLRLPNSRFAWLPTVGDPRIGHLGPIRCLATTSATTSATPDGAVGLLTGSADGTIRLWSLGSPIQLVPLQSAPTWAEFVPGTAGSRALAGSRDGTLVVVDLDRRETIRRFESVGDRVMRVACESETHAIALDEQGHLHRLALDGASKAERLDGPAETISSLASSTGPSPFLTVGTSIPFVRDGVDRPWRELAPIPIEDDGNPTPIRALAISSNGRHVVAANESNQVFAWDAESGRYLGRLGSHTSRVTNITIAKNAPVAFSSSRDGFVRVYDLERTEEISPPVELPDRRVEAIAVSDDGRELAVGTIRGFVELWDVPARVRVMQMHGHARGVYNLAFDAANRRLISSSWDGTIVIRDAR